MKKNKLPSLLIIGLILVILKSCMSDSAKNLGNGYFYRHEGSLIKDILCRYPEGGEIPATVLSYNYNKNFIIAKQKPKLPQDILYDKDYEYKLGEDTIYFWIIVKKEYLVLGPLDINEFDKARNEYNIPKELILD